MKRGLLILTLSLATGLGAAACREEGTAEKAGREIDEAIDELRHPEEGALEKLGREADEALEDAMEAITGEQD